MIGYAISSNVPDQPITTQIATALLENLRRIETLWSKFVTDPQSANAREWGCVAEVELRWDAATGAVDPDPNLSVVQLVDALPEGTPSGVIAYHTVDENGRPLSLISFVAAGSDWPSAMSHEIKESRIDPLCTGSATNPADGSVWDLETDDPVEGSDYEENGVKVSNGVGPRYFGLQKEGPLDIAGAVTEPFQELPTGYHGLADGSQVYGDKVTDERKAHVESDYGRPAKRRRARS